ncbi:MAG: hypothetical protein SGILL_000061 [Bacillariaceae sp.]
MDPEISLYHDEAQLANMVMDPRNSDGSTQSSPGFNFSLNPRKNLTEEFNLEVSALSKDQVVTQAMGSSKTIAVTALPATIRPPLHRNPSSQRQMGGGLTKRNKVAVYLRIRPPPAMIGKKKDRDGNAAAENNNSTIEILDAATDPGRFPTRIRTYPPTLSNAYKVNINRKARDLSAYAKEFSFDCIMGPQTSQKTVYSAAAAPMIHDLFQKSFVQTQRQGSQRSLMLTSSQQETALLFSYGITNAGKTHTVLGDLNSKNQSNWGIIPRAISDVFDQIQVQQASSGNGPASPQFQLYISYFEIYNEQVYDLIPSKKTISKHPFGEIPPLKVRECRGQTLVRGLAKHRVINTDHGIELTKYAHNKRHTSNNNLNSDSSRSHFVCQMQIVQTTKSEEATKMDDDDDSATVASMSGYCTDEEASSQSNKKTSTLWIVDLAGSERSKRTNVGSMRQKESTQINKSLMTLMRCLNGIQHHGRHGGASSSMIPFRESKLTHIFMSHLTSASSARTAIMVNVNPAVADFDETQHVLAYATKAKLIEMDPEEFNRKRKHYNGEEYDINGRKMQPNKTSPSKRSPPKKKKTLLSRMAKKLSPKRVFQKIPGSEILSPKQRGSQKMPAAAAAEFQSESSKMPSSAADNGSISAKIASLKAELDAAKSQVQSLADTNSQLQEELESKEDHIRSEVAVEMEERLRETRQRHQAKYDMLQAQIGQEKSETAFTVKKDKAETHLDELMDQVDECEKEMCRMTEDHNNNVNSMQSEIDQLKEELSVATAAKQEGEAKIKALEAKTKKYKKEIQKFELELRSKKKDVEEDEENRIPDIAAPKDLEYDDDGENSSAEPLNFSLNVAKKSYRRKLRPRKALKNASNKAFR